MGTRPTGERWKNFQPSVEADEGAPEISRYVPVETDHRETLGLGRMPRREVKAPPTVGLISDEARQAISDKSEKLAKLGKEKLARAAELAAAGARKSAEVARERGPGIGQKIAIVVRTRAFMWSLGGIAAVGVLAGGGYGLYNYLSDRPDKAVEVKAAPPPPAAHPAGLSEALSGGVTTAPAEVKSVTALADQPETSAQHIAKVQEAAEVAIGTPPTRNPKGFPIMPELDRLTEVGKEPDIGSPQAARGGAPVVAAATSKAETNKAAPSKTYKKEEEKLEDFFGDLNK
jgi:hypothetical protein